MGWMGHKNELRHALAVARADQDEKGNFLVSGTVVSFLGMGEEFVVGDDAMYYVDGKPCSISVLLNSTSYGVRNVTVI